MSKLLILMSSCLLFTALPIYADDIDDVRARAEYWAESISKGNPDLMVSLYDDAAILHGTVSPVVRQGSELIREYFAGNGDPGPAMYFVEPMHIRVFGDTAVNTGNYAAQFGDNEAIVLRYSFVYRKINGQWMIVDHHSSRLPE